MKKTMIFAVVLVLALVSGCSSYKEFEKNIIKIEKGDVISETIQEPFEESYYSEEELLSSIEAEVASYNGEAETAMVELKKCSIEEQMATVQMKYASSADYAAFNHVGLFHGTFSEFAETEYHAYADLKDANGEAASLSSLAAADEEYYVVALDIDCILEVKGTICYVSEGVEILSKKAADVTMDDEAYAYIVYQ